MQRDERKVEAIGKGRLGTIKGTETKREGIRKKGEREAGRLRREIGREVGRVKGREGEES